MWLWQAEGPQTGTGADETFAPGHCLPHLAPTKNDAKQHSPPRRHQSVSHSSWDISCDCLSLGPCVCSVHTATEWNHLLKDSKYSLLDLYWASFFSKCQMLVSLTSKRSWQLSRSVSLWWTSSMACQWLPAPPLGRLSQAKGCTSGRVLSYWSPVNDSRAICDSIKWAALSDVHCQRSHVIVLTGPGRGLMEKVTTYELRPVVQYSCCLTVKCQDAGWAGKRKVWDI